MAFFDSFSGHLTRLLWSVQSWLQSEIKFYIHDEKITGSIFSCFSSASSLSSYWIDQTLFLTALTKYGLPFYTHLVLRGPNSCNYQLIINFQELRSNMTHLAKCNGGQNVISPLAITSYRLCCLLCWAAKLALHVICSLHQSRIEVGLPEPCWCSTMLVFQFLNFFQNNSW